jgi:hypothetical protein
MIFSLKYRRNIGFKLPQSLLWVNEWRCARRSRIECLDKGRYPRPAAI